MLAFLKTWASYERKKKLLIEVSITDACYLDIRDTLILSLRNAVNKCRHELSILIVYQTKASKPPVEDELKQHVPNLEFYHSCVYGVSLARNIGLDYGRKNKYDYIIFHDSDIFLTDGFMEMANEAMDKGFYIAKGDIKWVSNLLDNSKRALDQSFCYTNAIYDSFICSYIFSIEYLQGCRFAERMGPGEKAVLNAGEDIVFIYNAFSRHWRIKIPAFRDAYVNHHQRSPDDAHRLLYAEAQGTLVRWMVSGRNFSLWSFIHLFAFFGNAFFSIISGRKNALRIFILRIKGFIDIKNKRKVIE